MHMGIRSDIKNPFNMLMLFIAVVAIIISAYFFFKSKRLQRPTYLISTEISKVYDSKRTSPNLILLNASNQKIEKDVFLVTVHFWNSGNLSIEPQDIRKPVEFTIPNCEKVVDYNVVSQTNRNITNFSLSPGSDQRSLVLNWTHLDPNNGAKFQVFYTGPPNPEFLFTGNILGKTVFVDGRSLYKKLTKVKFGWIIGFPLFGMLGFFFGRFSRLNKKRLGAKNKYLKIAISLSILAVCLLLFFFIVYWFGAKLPPA